MKTSRIMVFAAAAIAFLSLSTDASAATAAQKATVKPELTTAKPVQLTCEAKLGLSKDQREALKIMRNYVKDPYCCAENYDTEQKRYDCLLEKEKRLRAVYDTLCLSSFINTKYDPNASAPAAPKVESSSDDVGVTIDVGGTIDGSEAGNGYDWNRPWDPFEIRSGCVVHGSGSMDWFFGDSMAKKINSLIDHFKNLIQKGHEEWLRIFEKMKQAED